MKRPIRVLLIEDSENDAALVLLELREAGYEPICERVETARAMIAALNRQSWDVVIADYVLPQFSGPAALKLLQERRLDLPFIIVSGHIDEDTAVASMKAGAHDYVMKGRLTRLVPAIEREMQEAQVRRARRLSEEEFAREQTFRRAIEDSIPSGIAAVNRAGLHTYVNPAFCQMVGWSEADLLAATPPYPYWPPEEIETIKDALSKVNHGHSPPGGFELRFRHRNEKRFDVLFLASPIKDPDDNITGWLGSVTDITERKRAEGRLRVQYAVARALSKAPNLKSATPSILAAIGESMGWEVGGLWRFKPGADELFCVATWRKTPGSIEPFETALRSASTRRDKGLPSRVLATGQPIWVPDLSREPGSLRTQIPANEGLHAACGFPIRLGKETLGVIEFFSREIREPDDTLLQWMVAIGNQIGQFMEREMAEEGLRRAHDELEKRVQSRTADLMAANVKLETSIQERKRLEHELLEITEKERRRIGLDLHDDLGQKLAGLTLMMKGLELSLKTKKLPEAESAHKIQALIQQTVNHAGDLARDLALADLDEDNLPSALKGLASNVKNLFDISCQFKSEGRIPPLEKNVIMQFYKITQEAVTNAVKHGKARQVGINLVNASDHLTLTVHNNGLPFPALIDQSKGMGLRIMNYRASVIGASLEIKPGRPRGTLVTCSLPNKTKPARNGQGRSRQPA
ncbi:MAG: hypothetical protein JWR26_4781 [Pedosphaera sp.]|nr:hypothetical protein [Pedosphaera sp.]